MQNFLNQPTFAAADKSGGSSTASNEDQVADTATPEDAEDPFAKAAKARKERRKSGGPRIVHKAKPIPPITKLKAWFRTHPEAIFEGLPTYCDPSNEDMEDTIYLVSADLVGHFEALEGYHEYTGYLLCTAAQKNLLLLVKEAGPDGSMHSATEAKHDAAVDATEKWTRLTWDRDAGHYDTSYAENWDSKPTSWPADLSEANILRQAFSKLFIDSEDHPAVKKALGL